jgi:3-hydroxyisobutyrate dehydrogenase
MARIAFMGLGKMGFGMAARLLAAGHELRVYNRTPAKGSGRFQLFGSPAEAAAGADAVISMVADDAASKSVWQSVFAHRAAGATQPLAIECSTLSYDWVLELAATAVSCGFRYIDAPVTGLPDMAAAGTLTLLVGADLADLDCARPILGAFSQRVLHFGAIGTGTAYKLIINLLGAVQIASAGETMALAERAGLDLRLVAEAIAGGQAASPQVVRNTQRMVADDHDRNITFTPRLRLKDVDYALRLADKLGLGVPFGTLAARVFQRLCATGHGDENESNVIRVARSAPAHRQQFNDVK